VLVCCCGVFVMAKRKFYEMYIEDLSSIKGYTLVGGGSNDVEIWFESDEVVTCF
jgi:hypothetical protein